MLPDDMTAVASNAIAGEKPGPHRAFPKHLTKKYLKIENS
jgi:hypothetical protein